MVSVSWWIFPSTFPYGSGWWLRPLMGYPDIENFPSQDHSIHAVISRLYWAQRLGELGVVLLGPKKLIEINPCLFDCVFNSPILACITVHSIC